MRMTGLLLMPLAMVALVASAQARSSAAVTAAADVRALGASIDQMHPDPYRAITKAQFEAAVEDLARRAPELSRDEVLAGMLRIVALLGPRNGHTGIFPADPSNARELHLYPLRLYDFADGLFVVDAADRSLVRDRLVSVNGMPIDEVLARVRPLVPRDNDSNLRGMAPHYLLTAEVLHGLDVLDGIQPATFGLERPDGERVEARLAPIPADAYVRTFPDALHGHYPSVLPSAPRPLYLAGSARPMSVRTLAAGRAVYFQFNSVQRPLSAFVRKLQRLAFAPSTRRVIVDLRLNGGGDNTTYGSLLDVLRSKQVNRRGKLYLLTGRATFSAAANFAADVDRFTRAIVVGEPTGGGVETYGDTSAVSFPTVGLTAHIATRYHERKRGPHDLRLAVEPDIGIDLTSSQYVAGRDPVLERALRAR
jgi:hypothetical protein